MAEYEYIAKTRRLSKSFGLRNGPGKSSVDTSVSELASKRAMDGGSYVAAVPLIAP